jgi:putative hemolysin
VNFQIVFVGLLILINGFFAAAEISVIAARKSNIRQLSEKGSKRAQVVTQLQGDMERFLATVQIGMALVGSAASAVGGVAAIELIKPWMEGFENPAIQRASEVISVGIVVVLISYLTLIFGELVPKSLALRYPERIALFVSGPLELVSKFSSPFIHVLTATSRLLLRPFGPNVREGTFISEDEIKLMLKEGRERGVFDQTEQELIHSVFEFNDISVKEVMVPRPKIHSLQIDTPSHDVLRYVTENKFSRYPVYKTTINDICGVLVFKDMLGALARQEEIHIKELLHPVYFVPETMKVSYLLKELQRRRLQMAIVVNEYGSVEGLVTMEDLVEEIVGEIRDEYDVEERPVERLKDGSLVIDASLSVRDLRNDFGLPIPESSEYETLGGFVLSQLQNMPRGGEIIRYGDYKFTIVDMEGRRIAKLKVERKPGPMEKVPSKV